MLRFHTQTAGVSLTAQQPEVNLARVAIEALAGVLGGTQSLHTDSYDEALALPTEKAARLALRTQQVIAEETGVANVADPLGGSWFVESLTDDMERRAEEVFSHLTDVGAGSMLEGVLAAIEDGWFSAEIADSAYRFQSKVADGSFVVVGVNRYTDGDEGQIPTLYIDPAVESRQLEQLARVKHARRRRSAPLAGPPEGRGRRSRHQPHARPDRGGAAIRDRGRGDVGHGVGLRDLVRAGLLMTTIEAVTAGDHIPLRVLLAKVGLDGHDRGLRIVARILRDNGMEVVFAGLRQTPESIATAVVQEDVDVVGVSMHNGAHLTLAPAVVDALRHNGLDTPLVIGGIVPDVDVPKLKALGVAAVLGPGAANDEVVTVVRRAAEDRAGCTPTGPPSGP
jgi:methylmalonyl-CoA mutase cobalamin-binding domain/chain